MAPPVTPGWVTWLAGRQLTDDGTGHCLSWWNGRRTGYPYPEISGLLLALLTILRADGVRSGQLQRALLDHPGGGGSVGRHGVPYTFDLAMAVRGLLLSMDHRVPDGHLLRVWMDHLVELVESERATGTASPLTAQTHWSSSFGAHQLKTLGALAGCVRVWSRDGDAARVARAESAMQRLRERTGRLQQPTGRFVVHALSTVTYVHSHCYAVEGLLLASSGGRAARCEEVTAAADWLASVQQDDGGFSAWHDGMSPTGPQRADATAQAVRIFRLVDPHRFGDHIGQGCAFLRRSSVRDGGVRYEPGSPDVNSWATIFAVQALATRGEVGELTGPQNLV